MLKGLVALLCGIFFFISLIWPLRFLPITSFYEDIFSFTGLLFGCLYCYLINSKSKLHLPIIILPLLLLIFLPLLQYFFDQIYFFETAFLSTCFIAAFSISILIGYNLSIKDNSKSLVYICSLILIISTFSSIISICQWLNIFNEFMLDKPHIKGRYSANIGQPNHMATLVLMGLISVWFSYEKKIFNNYFIIFLLILNVLGLALTQSRTPFISISIIIFFYCYYNKIFDFKLSFKQLLLIVFAYSIFWFRFNNLNIKNEQISSRFSSGYERLNIWLDGLHYIMIKPLTGWGTNQTMAAQFYNFDEFPSSVRISSLHNIILDCFLWFGIPITLLILFIFFKILINVKTRTNKIFIFPTIFFSCILVHSMLEYPLHYSYFLIPFGIFLGYIIAIENFRKLYFNQHYMLMIFLFGGVMIFLTFTDYNKTIDNQLNANLYEIQPNNTNIEIYNVVFFDQQDYKSKVVFLDKNIKINNIAALDKLQKFVSLNNDIFIYYKYLWILVNNGKIQESNKLIDLINHLYGQNLTYDEVFRNVKDK